MELKKPSLTLLLYLLVGGLSFVETPFNQLYYDSLSRLEILLISLFAYQVCSGHFAKSILYTLTAYSGYVLLTDWYFDYVSLTQWFVEIVLFSTLALFQMLKNYSLEGDALSKENIVLAFYKPKNYKEYLVTLLGSSVSSMSIISGDNWYMFKRKKSTLQCIPLSRYKFDNYVLIDTGVKISNHSTTLLNSLIGTKASDIKSFYFRCKCVFTFKDLLESLGSKWRIGWF
ncbi:hypothetical protein KAR91_03190, partial [Candidatus Pacearchaeota archaeon]|nr:hypothetical protein [Candidatus Pacearchaeota archaeon]